MTAPFLPVSRPFLSGHERRLLLEAWDSSWISSTGHFLTEFESRFASACGVSHALAVSNGTVALHLALEALGIGPDDEVIVPSLTYIATANAVRYCGAEPRFADISEIDWCLDVDSVAALITPQTRAVIAVHLYGHPANMRALRALCTSRGLFLVEDAAEAPFASRDGERTGGMGDVATFSFYGNKILTCGEGGAVTTSDDALAERMRLLRGQGMDPDRRYWFPVVGHNFRLTNLAAAILSGQLDRIDEILRLRRDIYAQYTGLLKGNSFVELQPIAADTVIAPWLYSITTSPGLRDGLMSHLSSVGIDSRPFFIPLHTMPPYEKAVSEGSLDRTTRIASSGLNVPTFPDMKPADVERVATAVTEFLSRHGEAG